MSFDLWLTLIRSNPRFKAERNAMLHRALDVGLPLEQFAAALRRADVEADRASERTGLDHALADRLRRTCILLDRPWTLDDGDVGDLLERQRTLARSLPPEFTDISVPDRLAQLAALVPLAITSNTGMIPGQTMRDLLRDLGVLEHFVVRTFSDEVGRAKPDPAIFQSTVRALAGHAAGLTPDQVLHLGDNPVADAAGASAAGLTSLLVEGAGRPPIEVALELVGRRLRELEPAPW